MNCFSNNEYWDHSFGGYQDVLTKNRLFIYLYCSSTTETTEKEMNEIYDADAIPVSGATKLTAALKGEET